MSKETLLKCSLFQPKVKVCLALLVAFSPCCFLSNCKYIYRKVRSWEARGEEALTLL